MQIIKGIGADTYIVRHEGKNWFTETLREAFEWAQYLLDNPKA